MLSATPFDDPANYQGVQWDRPSKVVTLNWDDFPITEGYLLKKGGTSPGLMGRRTWKKRWYAIDPQHPTEIFYYASAPADLPSLHPHRHEPHEAYKQRYLREMTKYARGRVSLLHASIYIPEPTRHKDKRIKHPYEFVVVSRYRDEKSGKPFEKKTHLYALTEQSFIDWTNTIRLICNTLAERREDRRRWTAIHGHKDAPAALPSSAAA